MFSLVLDQDDAIGLGVPVSDGVSVQSGALLLDDGERDDVLEERSLLLKLGDDTLSDLVGPMRGLTRRVWLIA